MHNLITDVAGLRVGSVHDTVLASGVTVARIDRPNVASMVVGGGAPGLRDTGFLAPGMTVESVDAIVLSGGSAFGLDAAGGVMSLLREEGTGLRVRDAVVPIVAEAIIFDLLAGGDKSWGEMPPYWHLGRRAAEMADAGPFALGTCGGGYGATTANLKGGLGSASTLTTGGATVGALAVVNALGATTIGDGPHFWAAPYERGGEFGGRGLPERVAEASLRPRMKGAGQPATTIALIATDAVLTKAQVWRMARMADDGLARAIRPAHAPMDGDTVFAVATLRTRVPDDPHVLTEIGTAAADCLARAVARAVYEATTPSSNWHGPRAWRDVFTAQSGG